MGTRTVHLAVVLALIFSLAAAMVPAQPATAQSSAVVSIPATQLWVDTGLTVSPGDEIEITASGTCIWGDPHGDNSGGPDGTQYFSGPTHLVTDPTIPAHSLVGNIADSSSLDGKGFFVGSSFQGVVPISNTTTESGKLFLSFNDACISVDRSSYNSYCWTGDNHGSFTVNITITSPPPAQSEVRIAFDSTRYNIDGNQDIYSMKPDGTGLEPILIDPASDRFPAVSPDGTKLAFVSNRAGNQDIWVMDLQTSQLTNLTADNTAYDLWPSWSPGGDWIAFGSRRGSYDAIWKVPSAGGQAIQVTFPGQPTPQEVDYQPDWSSDGNTIVFMSTQGHRDRWSIYVVNVTTLVEQEIIPLMSNECEPSYSGNDDRVAWVHVTGSTSNIWTREVDGTQAPLTSGGYSDQWPHWSPDGTKIAFYSNRSGRDHIHLMNSDGTGSLDQITSGDWDDRNPNFYVSSAGQQPAAEADLGISKTVSSPTPSEGDTVIYTVTLTNNGPDTATGIVVTDSLPGSVSYVTHSAGLGTYASGSGLWSVGSLANGATATLPITVTVDPGTGTQTITNTASVTSADQADPVASNNSNSAPITVQSAQPSPTANVLIVEDSNVPSPYNPGATVSFVDMLDTQRVDFITSQPQAIVNGTVDLTNIEIVILTDVSLAQIPEARLASMNTLTYNYTGASMSIPGMGSTYDPSSKTLVVPDSPPGNAESNPMPVVMHIDSQQLGQNAGMIALSKFDVSGISSATMIYKDFSEGETVWGLVGIIGTISDRVFVLSLPFCAATGWAAGGTCYVTAGFGAVSAVTTGAQLFRDTTTIDTVRNSWYDYCPSSGELIIGDPGITVGCSSWFEYDPSLGYQVLNADVLSVESGDVYSATPSGFLYNDQHLINSTIIMEYQDITGEGTTTVTHSQSNPAGTVPSDVQVIGPFTDLITTATYAGPITIGMRYDETGVVDEGNLRLFHSSSPWEDVTTWVDTANNIVYGQVSSLSWFFIGGEWVYATETAPVFPNIYAGIAAAMAAAALAYVARGRILRREQRA